jgi:PAS domain S-box-containing protein
MAALAGVYFGLPAGTLSLLIYPLFGFLAAAAIVWGIRLYRPEKWLSWLLIATGTAFFSVGDIVYNVFAHFGAVPFPSWDDAAYLVGYAFLAAGIVALMPSQHGRSRILALLDTTIVTLAAGAYLWVFVVQEAAKSAGRGGAAQIVAGAYPVMDLVLLAFLIRLILGGALANRAVRLLGAGLLALLVTDAIFYGWCQPHGLYLNHSHPDFGWILSYLLCAAAGLHRSVREEIEAPVDEQVGRVRMAALALALVSGPLILIFELRGLRGGYRAYELAVLLLLVFGRMAFSIFEQRDLLKEVSDSERQFRSLIENGSDLITVIDAESRYTYQSPSVMQVLGYRPEERQGKSLFDYIPEDEQERVRQGFAALKEGQILPSLLFRVRHKDGNIRLFDCSFSVRFEDPTIKGIVINSHDVTERQQLEGQLVQAQKMEAVGQLAGGVAHDFNNILQAISGYTELATLAQDEQDAAGVAAALLEIANSSRRAAAVSRQLLDFSRQDPSAPDLVDLGVVVAGVLALVQRMIGAQIEFRIDAPAGLGLVELDPVQLEQIVINMAVNARDAMPDGGALSIALNPAERSEISRRHPDLSAEEYLELSFSDTGHGMSQETMRRIFEPFFTTKEVGKGTGLGLATTYGIVSRVGGALDVQSELGAGTTFRVVLPVAARRPAEADELEPAARAGLA